MSNKTFETKALTFDHTNTHAPQNLQFHIRFLMRILSLEKFGTKWAAKTKDSFLYALYNNSICAILDHSMTSAQAQTYCLRNLTLGIIKIWEEWDIGGANLE